MSRGGYSKSNVTYSLEFLNYFLHLLYAPCLHIGGGKFSRSIVLVWLDVMLMTRNEIIPWRSFRTLSHLQGRTPGTDMRHQHPDCLPVGDVLPWFLVHLENSNQYTPVYHLYGHYTRESISLDLIRNLFERI